MLSLLWLRFNSWPRKLLYAMSEAKKKEKDLWNINRNRRDVLGGEIINVRRGLIDGHGWKGAEGSHGEFQVAVVCLSRNI